jgi:hypothetical protein
MGYSVNDFIINSLIIYFRYSSFFVGLKSLTSAAVASYLGNLGFLASYNSINSASNFYFMASWKPLATKLGSLKDTWLRNIGDMTSPLNEGCRMLTALGAPMVTLLKVALTGVMVRGVTGSLRMLSEVFSVLIVGGLSGEDLSTCC